MVKEHGVVMKKIHEQMERQREHRTAKATSAGRANFRSSVQMDVAY
jgi:hypothetical protein